MGIRLFLSACLALLALGAAWAEKGSKAEGSQPEIHYAPRENLEGLYVGHEYYIQIDDDPHAVAMASGVNTRQGSRRLLEFAFEHAVATGRKKVTIVHKANIMKILTGIFLEAGQELYERKYKGRFVLETIIIDACAMKLVLNPWQFDVLVTTNLFGDILSDLVAGLVGGLG